MKNDIINALSGLEAIPSKNIPLGALELTKRLGENNRRGNADVNNNNFVPNYGYLKRDFDFVSPNCPCTNVVYDQLEFCDTYATTERCIQVTQADIDKFDGLHLRSVFQKELESLLFMHDVELCQHFYSFIGSNAYTGNSDPLYIPGFLNDCDVDCSAINLGVIAGANGIVRDGSFLGTGNILGAVYGNSSMAKMVRSRFGIYEDLYFSGIYNVNTVLLIDNQRLSYHTNILSSREPSFGFVWGHTHIGVTVTEDSCLGEGWVVRFYIDWGLCPQWDNMGVTSGVYHLVFDVSP